MLPVVALALAAAQDPAPTARLVVQHRLPIARAVRILGLSSTGGAAATLDDAGELVVWSLVDGRPLFRRSLLASKCVKGKLLADPEAARFALLCHDGLLLWVDPAAADPITVIAERQTPHRRRLRASMEREQRPAGPGPIAQPAASGDRPWPPPR